MGRMKTKTKRHDYLPNNFTYYWFIFMLGRYATSAIQEDFFNNNMKGFSGYDND